MSDPVNPSAAPQEAAPPLFNLQRAYVQGMSLEMPQASKTFLQAGNPHVDLNVNVASSELQPGIFEVILRATLTSTLDRTTLFLLELDQAGIFEIRNLPAEHMPGVLQVSCPAILTPYLRAQIADMLTRATLPVFHMPEVNWAAMYEQRQREGETAPGSLH